MTQVMSLFIFPKPPQQPQDPLSQGSSSKQAHSTFLPLPSAIKQLECCNLPPASSRELPGTGQGSRSCCTSTAAAWALPGCDTQKAQCSKCSGYSWARSCCPAHPARSTASAACLELTACLAGHSVLQACSPHHKSTSYNAHLTQWPFLKIFLEEFMP